MPLAHNASTRVTNQAQTVYEVVKKFDQHLTADQIYQQARKSMPRISLGTVYRNLDQLTDRNLISRVIISGVARYESRGDRHYHVVCLSCQKVEDLGSPPAADIEEFFSRTTRYKLTGHELILYGICPVCQKKR